MNMLDPFEHDGSLRWVFYRFLKAPKARVSMRDRCRISMISDAWIVLGLSKILPVPIF
jgi:hypothetical protein